MLLQERRTPFACLDGPRESNYHILVYYSANQIIALSCCRSQTCCAQWGNTWPPGMPLHLTLLFAVCSRSRPAAFKPSSATRQLQVLQPPGL